MANRLRSANSADAIYRHVKYMYVAQNDHRDTTRQIIFDFVCVFVYSYTHIATHAASVANVVLRVVSTRCLCGYFVTGVRHCAICSACCRQHQTALSWEDISHSWCLLILKQDKKFSRLQNLLVTISLFWKLPFHNSHLMVVMQVSMC